MGEGGLNQKNRLFRSIVKEFFQVIGALFLAWLCTGAAYSFSGYNWLQKLNPFAVLFCLTILFYFALRFFKIEACNLQIRTKLIKIWGYLSVQALSKVALILVIICMLGFIFKGTQIFFE